MILGGGRQHFLSQDTSGSARNDYWNFVADYKTMVGIL